VNILFINAGRRCELVRAFKKVLPSFGGGGLLYASDIDPLAPALQLADESVIFPHTSTPQFLQIFIDFCVQKKIKVVIPTIDPDLVYLDKLRTQLAELLPDVYLLLPPSSVISIAEDKRKSRDAFAASGALVPEEISKGDVNIEFPVFIKPARGSASVGAQRIHNQEELILYYEQLCDPMLEKLIEGPEYTVDVFCSEEKKALLAIPRKRLAVRGGEVSKGVIERRDDLEELSCRLAEDLGCVGPVTLQFRHSTAGFVAMEINARLGGGLPLTLAAGGSWPKAILQLACGEAVDLIDNVQDGVILSRFDESMFIYKKSQSLAPDLSGVKLVIFDMDDTLFAERDFVYGAYHAVSALVIEKYGVFIEDELRRRFDEGQRGDLFTTVLNSLGVNISEKEIQALVKIYRSHTPHLYPYADVSVIKLLKQNGFKTGLISDGWLKVQQKKFDALKLSRYFDEVIFTDSLGREFWKPHPCSFELMSKWFDTKPSEMLYIGDNPQKDFITCNKMGMHTLRIRRHGGESCSKYAQNETYAAEYEISSLIELKSLLNL